MPSLEEERTMSEIDDIKHDIARHLDICSQQATEIEALRARVAELEGELRATLKWATRMGYRDLEARMQQMLERK